MTLPTPDSLRSFPLLRFASGESLGRLAAAAEAKVLEHGELIWRAGEIPSRVWFLRRGLIEVVRVTAGGAEVGLALFGPRECPGLFAALDGR
ncbi:MAG: cyclic nucleotide-binding domain-containing protein, partial [Myxococcales bacterium]|nr:cyclic nucleotide-binding domain-containing protein [Myxococcales bacterium]